MLSTVVEVQQGKLGGGWENGVRFWKGVPYAKPPIGLLRFQPPRPAETWEGVLDATNYSPAALQNVDLIMSAVGNPLTCNNEDCLYLNIWSSDADDGLRPVMVWIHGGAFVQGSGVDPWFDGTSFAKEGDVILVTITYRLGVMGFLDLADILGSEYEDSVNCGIMDQVAALRWIQDNITQFGGDPNRVTIFGQSAGAASVAILMTMNKGRSLFQQAILQSGTLDLVTGTRQKTALAAQYVLSYLGIRADSAAALTQISSDRLLEAQSTLPKPLRFGPVLEGLPFGESGDPLLSAASDIPVLIGTTLDEARLFIFNDPSWSDLGEEDVILRIQRHFGPIPQEVVHYYRTSSAIAQSPLDKLLPIVTDRLFTIPAIQMAERWLRQGGKVWMYRFDWRSPAFCGSLLASHSQELPFVFNNLEKDGVVAFTGPSTQRIEVAQAIHRAWIAFAHNGDPDIRPHNPWPAYDLENRATRIFDVESRVDNDPRGDVRVVWTKRSV